jgi:hypothetical protein
MSASDRRSASAALVFLTFASFFGLILAAVLAINPPVSRVDFVWRKPVVGSLFALVCVVGSLAVFFPNRCSKVFNYGKREKEHSQGHFGLRRVALASEGDSFVLRGHHPECDVFSSHVFSLGGRTFCATCSGLFLGAVVSLVGVAAYFFGSWHVGQNGFLIALVGVLGVTGGLLQVPLIKIKRSFVRVFSGVSLGAGAFLILVVVDDLARGFFLDVYLVFLTVCWLVTRISLSQWEHEKMCRACGSGSCVLERLGKNRDV